MNIAVKIDSREQTRVPYAKRFFSKYNPVVSELATGDYIFKNMDTDEQVCFEYKTIKDFMGSISDGRIFEQVKRMNDEFDWSFIVIEGTIEDLNRENNRRMLQKNTGRPFSLSQFYGAIARLNTYVTVTQCHNQAQCFNYLEKQALKIFDNEPLIKHFKKDTENSALNYLMSIEGIGFKTADLIVSEFKINTLFDLLQLVENTDLKYIKGIGEKTADNIEKNILGV